MCVLRPECPKDAKDEVKKPKESPEFGGPQRHLHSIIIFFALFDTVPDDGRERIHSLAAAYHWLRVESVAKS